MYTGNLLPGLSPDEVPQRLADLLKATREQADELINRHYIVFRSGLTGSDLARYFSALQMTGLDVHIEQEITSATIKDTVSPSKVSPLTICPVCGHLQPKRILCLNCATDMPKILSIRLCPHRTADIKQPETPVAQSASETDLLIQLNLPLLLGIMPKGRFGRLSFITASGLKYLLLFTLSIPLGMLTAVFASLNGSFAATVFASLAFIVLYAWVVRDAVLRLHDIGLSGWFALLLYVPYLGVVINCLLAIYPGQTDTNRFGSPASPPPRMFTLIIMLPFATILATLIIRRLL